MKLIKEIHLLKQAIRTETYERNIYMNHNLENSFNDLQRIQKDVMIVPINYQLRMQKEVIQDQIQKLAAEQDYTGLKVHIKIGLLLRIRTRILLSDGNYKEKEIFYLENNG